MRRTPLALAMVLAAAGLSVSSESATAVALPKGCDPARPAVAHHAGGKALAEQPADGPIPCGVTTGFGGAETRIRVTKSGALIYEPAGIPAGPGGIGFGDGVPGEVPQTSASPAGLTVSTDNGATWKLVKPLGVTWGSSDHQGHVDRDTGRFFWYALHVSGPLPHTNPDAPPPQDQVPGTKAHLLWSADEGKTFTYATACCPLFSENPRFATAPAPAGGDKPVGYPNVVYFCANTSIGFTAPVIFGRVCSKSLNGGTTWSEESMLFNGLVPTHSECDGDGEVYGATDGNYPAPASDGSLYVMVNCNGKTFLAKSTDEAATWPILKDGKGAPLEIPAAEEMRADPDDNLYLFKRAGAAITLQISRDEGQTWTPEMVVTAPGVANLDAWFPAVRSAGHVVVSYYGQRAGQVSYDGYLTESRNALAAKPVFWSAVVNNPAVPMLIDAQGTRAPGPGFLDYKGADIGPDGTAWGSYVQDCPPDTSDPVCLDPDGSPRRYGALAFVGRLAWGLPHPAPGSPGARPTQPGGRPLPATGAADWLAVLAVSVLAVAVVSRGGRPGRRAR